MSSMLRRPKGTHVLLVLLVILAAGGCHRPQGALMAYSGGSHTYFSYETMPKTVQLTDLRSNEILFSMDIPAGKQLTLDFVDGKGDDPIYSPDLMRYQVFDMGTTTGKLRNSMSVPAAAARRLDIDIRTGPEYSPAAPDRALRTDELTDRPGWWTPEGGPIPEDTKGTSIYD